LDENQRRCLYLIAAASHESIGSDHGPNEKTVFLEGLFAVFGAGRIHGAFPGSNRGTMIQRTLIKINQAL
jgi:hypothetical protein